MCAPVVRKVNETTVEVVATNGHALSRRAVVVGELAAALKDKVTYRVHEESMDALKLMLKGTPKTHPVFESEVGPSFFTVKNTQTGIAIRLTDTEYPNFDSIYPKLNPETTITVGFQPEYLMDLLKAMRDTKEVKMIYLSFDYSKQSKGEYLAPMPIQVGQEKLGLLMPCRKGKLQ